MQADSEHTKDVVQDFTREGNNYLRQLHIWLGISSAGGATALAGLAANLPNPRFAFEYLLVSFWSFLVGVVFAGLGLYAISQRSFAKGEHFASSHNREKCDTAINAIPLIISSPRRLADETNKPRNDLIAKREIEHQRAEHAWIIQGRWQTCCGLSLTISGMSFVFGFGWPLLKASLLGQNIVP